MSKQKIKGNIIKKLVIDPLLIRKKIVIEESEEKEGNYDVVLVMPDAIMKIEGVIGLGRSVKKQILWEVKWMLEEMMG